MVKLSTLVYATAFASVAFSAGFLTGTQVKVVYEHREEKETVSQNILGGPEPETYVTVNGIKYFSKIDGKEISDVVK